MFVNNFTGDEWEFGVWFDEIELRLLMEIDFGEVTHNAEILMYGEIECISVISLGRIHSFLN